MSDGAFLAYIALLILSGIVLLVTAAVGFGQSVIARVISGLFGAAFVGYAVYLFFFFDGGTVQIFFYAFAVPLLAVYNAVKSRKAKRAQLAYAATVAGQPHQQAVGSPSADPQAVPPTS